MPSFINVGYVWQILERGAFLAPSHSWAAPKRPILNRIKNTYFEEHLGTTASKHRSSPLEVFCRSCCSVLVNAVMKYSFSAALVQSWRTLHANLQKVALHHGYFSKNSPQVQNSDTEKCILMAASEDEFILETFLHGCFSKVGANIFILEILTHFTFLTLTSC